MDGWRKRKKYGKSYQSVNHKTSLHCVWCCCVWYSSSSCSAPTSFIQSFLSWSSFLSIFSDSTQVDSTPLKTLLNSTQFLYALSSSCTFIFNFKSINQHNRLILISLALAPFRPFETMSFRLLLLHTWCLIGSTRTSSLEGVVGGIDLVHYHFYIFFAAFSEATVCLTSTIAHT